MRRVIDKMIQCATLICVLLIIYMTLDVFIMVRKIQESTEQDECVPVELIEQLKEQGKELEHYGNL